MEVEPGMVRAPEPGPEWVNSSRLPYDVAKEVNLVMASLEGERAAEVLQSGKPLAPEDAGDEAAEAASG